MRTMSMRKAIRIQKLQNRHHMVGESFCTISKNERRKRPWLGSVWYEPGKDEKRAEFIKQWESETERLLKENPNLKII